MLSRTRHPKVHYRTNENLIDAGIIGSIESNVHPYAVSECQSLSDRMSDPGAIDG